MNTTTILTTTPPSNVTGNATLPTPAPHAGAAGVSKTALGLGVAGAILVVSIVLGGLLFVRKAGSVANAVHIIRHRGDGSFAFNSLTNDS